MLQHQDPNQSLPNCVQKAYTQLQSGGAHVKWVEMVQAQGGDVQAALDNCATFMTTRATNTTTYQLKARNAGFVTDINVMTIGLVGVDLGARRQRAGTSIDPWAGMSFAVKVGDHVEEGNILVTVFHDKNLAGALECDERIYLAFELSSKAAAEQLPITTHMVTTDGFREMEMVPYC